MLIGIVVASIIAYLTALVTIREKQIYQQIVFLLIYIIGMTFIGEMDILLPIYFLVSFFSIVINMNKISYVSIVIYAFFGCYLIFGLLFQNTIATCVSFIAKYWQFIVFFIVIDSKVNLKADVKIRQLQIALLVETLLGVYLLLTNSEVGDNGMIRLVSNSQPITGNIAVAVLPVSVYLYFKNKGNHRTETQIIFIELGFLFWIIMSGTRGYTLLYAITMLFVFYDYVFNNRKSGKNAIQNRFAILAFVCWLFLLLVIIVPGFADRISSILRIEDSTGIRSYENAAEWNFFWNAPWEVRLFGIGLGAKSAIVFMSAFVPCVINTYSGIKATTQVHLWVAQTFGASRGQMLKEVAIPTALPYIFTGLRVSLGASWTSLCAAEMLAASRGLGFMIQLNRQLARADLIIVGMLTIGAVGAILSVGLGYLEKKFVKR